MTNQYNISIQQPIYVTIAECAALMRLDKRSVRRKIAQGLLEAVGSGRGRRVVYESILHYRFIGGRHGTS